jgi:hypothetical protein
MHTIFKKHTRNNEATQQNSQLRLRSESDIKKAKCLLLFPPLSRYAMHNDFKEFFWGLLDLRDVRMGHFLVCFIVCALVFNFD